MSSWEGVVDTIRREDRDQLRGENTDTVLTTYAATTIRPYYGTPSVENNMTIHIQTEPVSVNRLYRGRRFLTKEGAQVKQAMSWEVKRSWGILDPLESILAVSIHLYFKDNKRRDLDNPIKAVLDCMTGIVYKDDSQITELHVYKHVDKLAPRIEVTVH